MPRPAKHAAPGDGHDAAGQAGKADPHAVLHPDANVPVEQLTAGRVRSHDGAEQRPPVMRPGALDASRLPSGGWLSQAAHQPSQPQPAPASPSQPQPAPARKP